LSHDEPIVIYESVVETLFIINIIQLYSELFVFMAFLMIVCMTINPNFFQSHKLILGIK